MRELQTFQVTCLILHPGPGHMTQSGTDNCTNNARDKNGTPWQSVAHSYKEPPVAPRQEESVANCNKITASCLQADVHFDCVALLFTNSLARCLQCVFRFHGSIVTLDSFENSQEVNFLLGGECMLQKFATKSRHCQLTVSPWLCN